jgi:hypothetical protein
MQKEENLLCRVKSKIKENFFSKMPRFDEKLVHDFH